MAPSTEQEKLAIELAKQDLSNATDRLVETAKRHANDVIADVAMQIRSSAHETTTAFSEDVHRVSEAVASGLRNVKAELTVPQVVKDHPFAWIVGGLAVGAAGLLVLRSVTKPLAKPAVRAAMGSSIGTKLALAGLEVGLSVWLARRERHRQMHTSTVPAAFSVY